MTGEQDERMAGRGPQGEPGEQGQPGKQGKRGQQGLSRAVRRAIVFLFLVNSALIAVGFLWLSHSVNANAGQRCASIASDARIPVPQPVAGNPSRLWEARFEAIERRRAHQLHCPGF